MDQIQDQNQSQNDNDKVSKKFDADFTKLIALLGGQEAFKKPKVKNEEVSTLVEELIKEQRDSALKEFKEKAKSILQHKVQFDKEMKLAEEDLKKLQIQKKKEFSEKMKSLFNIVDNIQEIENQYNISITEVITPIK